MTQDRRTRAMAHAAHASDKVNARPALNVITLSLHHHITSASAVRILPFPRAIHSIQDVRDVGAGEDIV